MTTTNNSVYIVDTLTSDTATIDIEYSLDSGRYMLYIRYIDQEPVPLVFQFRTRLAALKRARSILQNIATSGLSDTLKIVRDRHA